MRKNKFLILSCLMIVLLAGCNNQKTTGTTTNTTVATTETTTTEIASETSVFIDTEIVEDTTASQDTIVSTENEPSTPEETDVNNNVSEEKTKIISAIEAAIASSEHPTMMEVDDANMLSEFFLIDVNDEKIKEVVVYQCPMSATMSEIIVIKSDDVDYAKDILQARKDKAINQDAWYPADQDNAAASIVGTVNDYAYFIINSNAANDENVLVSELSV